jgi:hypothetical protein
VHSGEGKANQYLMRGYNLDHGTDLAVFVDGMPVNEPTHAHGQGYADVTYTKGTYYAYEGDFASVGAVHVYYLDTIPDQVSVGVDTLDYQRIFTADSTDAGSHGYSGAPEMCVRVMKAGAVEFLTKPVGVPSRKGILRTIAAVHHQRNQAVVTSLKSCFHSGDPPPAMLRRSSTWRRLPYAMIRILSPPRERDNAV